MRLFRSMREAADGLPEVGPTARQLGVRPGNVPAPDVAAILPTDPVKPGQGGMSVAPGDPMDLPILRRPASLGGIGRDPVWYIEADDLGADLQLLLDRPKHGLVEPSRPLTLQELQQALAATRNRWKL